MDKVHGFKLVEVRAVHFKLRENSFTERKTCFLKTSPCGGKWIIIVTLPVEWAFSVSRTAFAIMFYSECAGINFIQWCSFETVWNRLLLKLAIDENLNRPGLGHLPKSIWRKCQVCDCLHLFSLFVVYFRNIPSQHADKAQDTKTDKHSHLSDGNPVFLYFHGNAYTRLLHFK